MTRCPRLAGVGGEVQAPTARSAAGFVSAGVDARKLANLGKAEQIGHNRLAAAVLVGAIGMQSIAAAAGLQIDQRRPTDRCCRGTRRRRAWRSAFHSASPSARHAARQAAIVAVPPGLLIERAGRLPQFAEAGGADRAEMPCRRRLLRHQPAQGSQPGIDIVRRLRRHARQRSAPAASARCRRPALPRTRPSPASRPPPDWTSTCRQANAGSRWRGDRRGATAQ